MDRDDVASIGGNVSEEESRCELPPPMLRADEALRMRPDEAREPRFERDGLLGSSTGTRVILKLLPLRRIEASR